MTKAKVNQEIITEMQISKGLFELEKFLINTMPCSPSMRYLVTCWVISSFMRDDLREKALLHIVSSSGIGKSKVLERWSYLLDSLLCIGGGTITAQQRLAVKVPIIFTDSIENRDLFKSRRDFLVNLAMSNVRPVASHRSTDEVDLIRFTALGMLSGIEPFPESMPELINRTISVECSAAYRTNNYIHSDCLKEIASFRDSMLLAIKGLIEQKIKPALEEDRGFWLTKIKAIAPDNRLEDHLYMMVIIMEALSVYIPIKDGSYILSPEQVLDQWLCN